MKDHVSSRREESGDEEKMKGSECQSERPPRVPRATVSAVTRSERAGIQDNVDLLDFKLDLFRAASPYWLLQLRLRLNHLRHRQGGSVPTGPQSLLMDAKFNPLGGLSGKLARLFGIKALWGR
ncbi:hypothetical protein AOLI_G00262910 [Acnodon oligacanthus]